MADRPSALIPVLMFFSLVFVAGIPELDAQRLTTDQRAHFSGMLPKLLEKLEQRSPVHVIVLGDSVSNYFQSGGSKENEVFIKGYHCEFLRRIADRFYYTGGVRDIKPRKGNPDNLFPSVGPEITVHNLTRNGSVVLQALQWLTTDGLDNPTDLAIINFGINDATFNLGVVRYAQILNRCVQICQASGTEVLVLGCSLVSGDEPRFSIGETRPYSLAARRVAEVTGSAFVDLGDGSFIASRERAPQSDRAFREAQRSLENALFARETFSQTVPDKVHPSARGHRLLGKFLAETVVNGPPARAYNLSAICLIPELDGPEASLSLRLENRSGKERSGVLCPLIINRLWYHAEADIPFTLAPAAFMDFRIPYRVEKEDAIRHPIRAFHGVVPASFVIVDQEEQRLYDVESVSYPISVDWPVRGMIEVSDRFSFSSTVRNNTRSNISGRYRAEWHGQTQEGEVLVGANGKQALTFTFRVPEDGGLRVKETLNLEVTIGAKSYRFHRLVEASRAFALGQRIPLVSRAHYLPDVAGAGDGDGAVVAEFQATDRALALTVDLRGKRQLEKASDTARVDFTLDARPSTLRDEPGYAGTVIVSYTASDGPADVKKLVQAAFGEGYDRDLDMSYIKAFTTTLSDGGKRLSLEIPRAYFYLHEWIESSIESNLGVNLVLTLQTVDTATGQPVVLPEDTYALVDSGVHRDDTDGLGTLELSARASGRWTIRIH